MVIAKINEMSKYFTTKDIDKIKKKLEEAGAVPFKPGDMVEMDERTYKVLERLDGWAEKILRQAQFENN